MRDVLSANWTDRRLSLRTKLYIPNTHSACLVTSSKSDVICDQVGHSVIVVRVQDYCKSNEPISLKLVMIGPTYPKNSLTFGGDPVQHTDSGSLFHFPHDCGIREF